MKKYLLVLAALCMANMAFAQDNEPKEDENTTCESTCEARWVCVDEDQKESDEEATLADCGCNKKKKEKEATLAFGLFQTCDGDSCSCDKDDEAKC